MITISMTHPYHCASISGLRSTELVVAFNAETCCLRREHARNLDSAVTHPSAAE
jgi:hypothetical protein